ncbi:Topoisomerase 1-associated factor 1 [Dispira parvispora]|uniref:Topoisomerase 1-associated factor 1 n=1 Tax=Dispira parvispora TaxID=1520584 RepID=A0A9W8E8G9_9FUNG|nr:Topoisomerase 1-associated factor 1 [Dispira parvispora]
MLVQPRNQLAAEDYDDSEWWDKFQNQVFSVCSALGGLEQRVDACRSPNAPDTPGGEKDSLVYVMGDECLECMRDLKRYIRQDDDNPAKQVLSWLGDWSVLQRDLLPILELNAQRLLEEVAMQEETNDEYTSPATQRPRTYCVTVIELLVVMTWYVDPKTRQEAPGYDRMLCNYKLAFATHPTIIPTLLRLLVTSLGKPLPLRDAQDKILINGVLLLYRNLLESPDPHVSITASGELIAHGKLQEMLIDAFQRYDIYQLVLTMASSADEKPCNPYALLVLDILYLSFKDITPEQLVGDPKEAAGRITDRLAEEERQQSLDVRAAPSIRHSRFGGTYVMQSPQGEVMSLLTAQNVMRPLDHSLDQKKRRVRRVRPKPSDAHEKTRHPFQDQRTFAVLKQLVHTFLESGFNTLFTVVGKDIELERPQITPNDITHYFYLLGFTLHYLILAVDRQPTANRNPQRFDQVFLEPLATEDTVPSTGDTADDLDFDLVGAVVNLRGLARILRGLRSFKESKESGRVKVTVQCLHSLLLALTYMSNGSREEHREVVDHLLINLCYEASTLDLLLALCREADGPYADKSYLPHLFGTLHLYMRFLEHYANQKSHMFVRKKARKTGKRKAKSKASGSITDKNDDEVPEESNASIGPVENQDENDNENGNQDDNESDSNDEEVIRKYVEREFHLSHCEKDLARESVVLAYVRLLASYTELSSCTVYWIVTMFHRIAIKQGYEGFFFKMSILYIFNQILTDQSRLKVWARADHQLHPGQPRLVAWDIQPTASTEKANLVSPWSALSQFTEYIVGRFMRRLADNPLFHVEILFPVARSEALRPDLRIQETKSSSARLHGYDTDEEDGLAETAPNLTSFDYTVYQSMEADPDKIELSEELSPEQRVGAIIGILGFLKMESTLAWIQQGVNDALASTGLVENSDSEITGESSDVPKQGQSVFTMVVPEEEREFVQEIPWVSELLQLLHFQYIPALVDDDHVTTGQWRLAAGITTPDLEHQRNRLRKYQAAPLGPDGRILPSLKSKRGKGRRKSSKKMRKDTTPSHGPSSLVSASLSWVDDCQKLDKTNDVVESDNEDMSMSDDQRERVLQKISTQGTHQASSEESLGSLLGKPSVTSPITSSPPDTPSHQSDITSDDDEGTIGNKPQQYPDDTPTPTASHQSILSSPALDDLPSPPRKIRRLRNRPGHTIASPETGVEVPSDTLPGRLTPPEKLSPDTIDNAASVMSDDEKESSTPPATVLPLPNRPKNVYQSRRRILDLNSDSE